MTIPISQVREDRAWYGLALRHLRMASRLLRSGFADGAVFHAYHAYECVLSSFIAVKGYPVPPQGWVKLKQPSGKSVKSYPSPKGPIRENSAHNARIVFFNNLADPSKLYYTTHTRLSRFITLSDRQNSLYFDASTGRAPHERYKESFVRGLLPTLRQFARDVRREIP